MANDTLSPVIKLNPGLTFRGQQITEAQVKLLKRADRKAIEARPAEERFDVFLVRSIARLGSLTSPEEINEASGFLLLPDEERISGAINDLLAQFSETPQPDQPGVKREVLATDLLSQPFGLNPGISIDGVEVKSCIVRLLRRGELKQLAAITDPVEETDLSLWLSIVQLGDITDVTREHIDMLTTVDEERIHREAAELLASFRAEPKHECPQCGSKF
jgi:hypothetical protein